MFPVVLTLGSSLIAYLSLEAVIYFTMIYEEVGFFKKAKGQLRGVLKRSV